MCLILYSHVQRGIFSHYQQFNTLPYRHQCPIHKTFQNNEVRGYWVGRFCLFYLFMLQKNSTFATNHVTEISK